MAVLVPSLAALRTEFNLAFPHRDKTSDGWIGDQAHAARQSDHNPDSRGLVHAIDVDADLRTPGWSMTKAVEVIIGRCRTGAETRLQYVIWNRRIWAASYGWTARAYTGSNPHDKHAHFSSRYEPFAERNTKPWGLLAANTIEPSEDDMPLTAADLDAIEARVKAGALAAAETVRPYQTNAGQRLQKAGWNPISLRGLLEYGLEDAYRQNEATSDQLAAVRDQLLTAIGQTGVTLTDAQVAALGDRLAAAMPTAEQIAAAVNDDAAKRLQQ